MRGVGDECARPRRCRRRCRARRRARRTAARRGGQRREGQLRRSRVRAMRLDDDRVAGGERRGGVAAGNGEREREVARAEHGDRARSGSACAAGPAPAPSGCRRRGRWSPRGSRPRDGFGEQPELEGRAGQLARQARDAEAGLAIRDRDELVAMLFEGRRPGPRRSPTATRGSSSAGRRTPRPPRRRWQRHPRRWRPRCRWRASHPCADRWWSAVIGAGSASRDSRTARRCRRSTARSAR